MAKDIILTVEERTERGSSSARRLRGRGWLPAVFSGTDGESLVLKLNAHDFQQMLTHHHTESLIVDLDFKGGGRRKALLREVQHDPMSRRALHADFVEVDLTETMRVRVPLELVGEPRGVQQGGVLEHLLRDLEIECLPGDLVEEIQVDVSGLGIGDHLLVKDLAVDPKLKVLAEPDLAVAAVAAPRVEVEPVEAEEEAAAAAEEPEVIGRKKEEEGESEEGR